MKSPSHIFILIITFLLVLPPTTQPVLAQAPDPTEQTTALLDDELRTVYLGNLARQEHGIPPLRGPGGPEGKRGSGLNPGSGLVRAEVYPVARVVEFP